MKIYTKTGDDGTTGLFGGGRVPKNHPRVEAYGTIDELNSALGLLRATNQDPGIDALLARAQADLFALGADLATPLSARESLQAPSGPPGIRRFAPQDEAWLEAAIDRCDAELAPLRTFILPGGTPAAAAAHVARAVCRRAERAAVTLAASEPIGPAALIYLNRLSDFLFTLSRVLNHRAGIAEEPWKP